MGIITTAKVKVVGLEMHCPAPHSREGPDSQVKENVS